MSDEHEKVEGRLLAMATTFQKKLCDDLNVPPGSMLNWASVKFPQFLVDELLRDVAAQARREGQDELIQRHRCGCEACVHGSELCPASKSSLAMELLSSERARREALDAAVIVVYSQTVVGLPLMVKRDAAVEAIRALAQEPEKP